MPSALLLAVRDGAVGRVEEVDALAAIRFGLPWKEPRPILDCVIIRASFGTAATLLSLGPLCSTWPVGTPRGAKLPLGDTLGHAGPVGAWGFAGAYHKGLVVSVHRSPRTNPVPKTATNRQPNQE